MKKANKGITLVSLVITIIVLLILAGITINLTIGERGIIKMAQQSGKNYLEAKEQEEQQLNKLDEELANYIGGIGQGNVSIGSAEKLVLLNASTNQNTVTYTVEKDGLIVVVSSGIWVSTVNHYICDQNIYLNDTIINKDKIYMRDTSGANSAGNGYTTTAVAKCKKGDVIKIVFSNRSGNSGTLIYGVE